MTVSESKIYELLAQHINTRYPGQVVYHFDSAGINNPSKYSRSLYSNLNGRGFPDFVLYKTVMQPGTVNTYPGLALEIKVEGTQLKRTEDVGRIFKYDYKVRKAGDWWDLHTEEQATVLERLAAEGWIAQFGVGIDECITYVDSFMAGVPILPTDSAHPPTSDDPRPSRGLQEFADDGSIF